MGWGDSKPEPFFQEEIGDEKCVRCGAPATFQWQICSDGNNYRPICTPCDIGLNKAALEYVKHPRAAELIEAYEQRVAVQAEDLASESDEVSVLQQSVDRSND